jgi:hypothetical protein
MSGRGKNRGGRGRFHRKLNTTLSPKTKNQDSKMSIKDWNYYISSAKQASKYKAITEFLVNHIKETYVFGGKIAITIVSQEPINTDSWKPRLHKSSDPDPETKETENEQYKMEFQANFSNYRICD